MTGPAAGTAAPGPRTVVVIGAGLIGTSVALALRERGAEVWLADTDPAAARLAADLGAGAELPAAAARGPADLAVLAVPPGRRAPTLAAAQARGLARCYTDVASVKELPLARARELGCDLAAVTCRASAVRARAVGSGRRQGGPVPRPTVGDLPAAGDHARRP